MAAGTVSLAVKKLPAALGGRINGIRIASNKTIEGRINRNEGALVGGKASLFSLFSFAIFLDSAKRIFPHCRIRCFKY
jgi:hypothetical protein